MVTKKGQARPTPSAAAFLPQEINLDSLRRAVQRCQGCDIYRNATQAVFGEIDAPDSTAQIPAARMMMIGEQPGDREDKEGHPFVGPAGRLLDTCLHEAGIDRAAVYVTNTVKHFKWEPRGKLRIHKKPSAGEIFACRPWLDAELHVVQPALIVCLGAVAAQSLLGPKFKVTESHGQIQRLDTLPPILASFHPASILRAIKEEDRQRQTETLVQDLRTARRHLSSL
jgi:DNA polymerase